MSEGKAIGATVMPCFDQWEFDELVEWARQQWIEAERLGDDLSIAENEREAYGAEVESLKQELKYVRGNLKNALDSIGQGNSKHRQRKQLNERLMKENAELMRRMEAVRDAVLECGGTWRDHGDWEFEIVPPEIQDMVDMCREYSDARIEAEAERDKWRDMCGRLLDAAQEMQRVASFVEAGERG